MGHEALDRKVPDQARCFLAVGVSLLAVGVLLHEWTISYFVQPSSPFRLTARVHWWYVSLNAWGIGLWLIFWRNKIQPIAVIATSLLCSLTLFFLLAVDLARSYAALTHHSPRGRVVIGEYLIPDEELGWTVKPGGKARVVREGWYDVSYNIGPEGFRRTIPDPEIGQRVYVLGDSFAFGWGVNDDETFSSRLAERQNDRVKVFNLGVDGYGITQIYARFSKIQANLESSDIVIFTLIGDDIHRTWPDFMFVSRQLFGRRPLQHFPVFEDGAIRIEQTNSIANKLKALFVHAPWLGSACGPLLLRSSEKAIEDATHMIAKVRDLVEARGARLMLIQLPTGAELQRNQIPLDLSDLGALQIRNRFPTDPKTLELYFISRDDGHYSSKGHRLVGDILQEELTKRGWMFAPGGDIGPARAARSGAPDT